jgi:hypothetical protein
MELGKGFGESLCCYVWELLGNVISHLQKLEAFEMLCQFGQEFPAIHLQFIYNESKDSW